MEMRSSMMAIHSSPRECIELEREFWQSIQPLLSMKMRIYDTCLLKYILTVGGELSTVEYIMTDSQREVIATLDKCIQTVADRYKPNCANPSK